MKRWKNRFIKKLTSYSKVSQAGIQVIIAFSFTLIACITILLLSIVFYSMFSTNLVRMKTESAEQFLNQTKRSLEDYLRSNRSLSDALYYSCIKDIDLSQETLDESFNLVYEANKDNIVSISLYTKSGEAVCSVPIASKTDKKEIIRKDWFVNASNEVENLHFTLPHVKNLSDDSVEGYRWIISLSREVELVKNRIPQRGVLLVDIRYSGIEQLLDKVNSDKNSEYIYLCDEKGNIIYHPKQSLINAGLYSEKTVKKAIRLDGSHSTKIGSEHFILVTKNISYTGWKLVSVVSQNGYGLSNHKMQYLFILFICITILGILIINQQLSRYITRPLIKLDQTIRQIEAGDLEAEFSIEGPKEVEHLGNTLCSYVQTIQQLMDEVLEEQELKRRSELDALQSQINPHFLYNTLDSVMWMIEDQQNDGAVYMIKELAKLLRISISKGRNIITVREEILHAQSYMNIQNVRYKNQFVCNFAVENDILDCCTIKLIIQPLLENAINYGVQGMEDDGEIFVKGYRYEDDIYLEVIDNGYGMTQEKIDSLLLPDAPDQERKEATHGNGVGLKNVNTRIKMQFGQEYGLFIESERGEGTMMRIKLPYMIYRSDLEEMLKHPSTKNNMNKSENGGRL